jgi:tRNA modification GTPase
MISNSTIAAIASPPGTGAVALLRMSGVRAREIAGEVFSGPAESTWEPRRQYFGKVLNRDKQTIDEVLLTYFPAPRSFTGESVVEIACHGGIVVTRRILARLLEAGAEAAAPGEFSQRAFLNGKIDLTQAEAIMDLISAKTELASRAAQEQLSGRFGREVADLREKLIGITAHVEAYIDFPDEDISPDSSGILVAKMDMILVKMEGMLSTATQGRILREGIATVICGAPNAGKSSLLNLMLGFDRAIVSDLAGTTRDTIEEFINLRGIPLRLIDTAGLRESDEEVEKAGIARSRQKIAGAELVILLIDGNQSSGQVPEIEVPPGSRLVRLVNKADLPVHADWREAGYLLCCCREEEDREKIVGHLYDAIIAGGSFDPADLVAINARHQRCLERAEEALRAAKLGLLAAESPEFVAMDLRASLAAVGDVIGAVDPDEILGEIFSQFCIGK